MSTLRDKLAYLAGIIDGEGTISLQRFGSLILRPAHIYPRITISNTDMGLINWLCDNFGGKYRKQAIGLLGRKQCWSWSIQGQGAVNLLVMVLPWLLIKPTQAWLCLEFWAQRVRAPARKSGVPPEQQALRQGFMFAVQYLNSGTA
jgi:hypothetical protein